MNGWRTFASRTMMRDTECKHIELAKANRH